MQYQQKCITLTLNAFLICIGSALLFGCSHKGDFGRPRQLKIQEIASAYAHDFFLGSALGEIEPKSGQYPGDPFGLTKHEIIVRDAAVHFNQPLTKKHRPPGKHLSPTAYAEYMTSAKFTHGKSRTTFISDQIKSDYVWLKRFTGSARKVKIDDGERAFYLQTRKFGITNQDHLRTYSRIKENEFIVYGVFKDLDDRMASYAYAIDRIPLEIPDASTAELKTALETLRKEAAMSRVQYDKLARRIARYRINFPKRWRTISKQKYRNGHYNTSGGKSSVEQDKSGSNDITQRHENTKNSSQNYQHSEGNSYSQTYEKYSSDKDSRRKRVHMTTLNNLSPKLMKLRVPKKVRYKKSKPVKPVKNVMKRPVQLPTKRMMQVDSWPMVITPTQK